MISRIFSIDDGSEVRDYKGFDGRFYDFDAKAIAIIKSPKVDRITMTVMALDDCDAALKELKRCMEVEDLFENSKLLGVFRRVE